MSRPRTVLTFARGSKRRGIPQMDPFYQFVQDFTQMLEQWVRGMQEAAWYVSRSLAPAMARVMAEARWQGQLDQWEREARLACYRFIADEHKMARLRMAHRFPHLYPEYGGVARIVNRETQRIWIWDDRHREWREVSGVSGVSLSPMNCRCAMVPMIQEDR